MILFIGRLCIKSLLWSSSVVIPVYVCLRPDRGRGIKGERMMMLGYIAVGIAGVYGLVYLMLYISFKQNFSS
jgi:hypothetical protein